MNRISWLTSKDPAWVLSVVDRVVPDSLGKERKLQLFGVALWEAYRQRCHPGDVQTLAAQVREYADDRFANHTLAIPRGDEWIHQTIRLRTPLEFASDMARLFTATDRQFLHHWFPSPVAAAVLLREVFGDIFSPVAFDDSWRTADVLSVANAAYEPLEDGKLDAARLGVLHDALLDAGCPFEAWEVREVAAKHKCPKCGGPAPYRRGVHFDHERICVQCNLSWEPGRNAMIQACVPNSVLNHLRMPGSHIRGCWALDLVLGKA